jgi:hypothetical protein
VKNLCQSEGFRTHKRSDVLPEEVTDLIEVGGDRLVALASGRMLTPHPDMKIDSQ